ncbi:MAG: M1 family metallopeptidase [Chloroflexi bacterium]|nr:M1 family metallopeptidase [Chloroflexota bacterium]
MFLRLIRRGLLLAALILTWSGCGSPQQSRAIVQAAEAAPARASHGTRAPTPPPAEPAPTAAPELPARIAEHRAALRPAFADDLWGMLNAPQYLIEATIDPDAATIAGVQQIIYTNREPDALTEIPLRLFPNLPDLGGSLTLGDITVDGVAVTAASGGDGFLAIVPLPQPLAPGATTTLGMRFVAQAPINGQADYYAAYNRGGDIFALANATPLVAMRRAGAWDLEVPSITGDLVTSETSLYTAVLTIANGWKPVTSGSIVAQDALGEQVAWRIVSGPQRDFTIVATPWSVIEADVDGTMVRMHVPPSVRDGAGRAGLDAAARALRLFNERFGPYPFSDLDLVQIDAQFFLGVEYPGVLLLDRRLFRELRELLDVIVAHEVAHLWWYALVGNDVQRAAWIDEGLATYAQVIYREAYGGPDAAAAELADIRQEYLRVASRGYDMPLDQPVAAFSPGLYYQLVYNKGALFFAALRRQIGDEAFFAALRQLAAARRYQIIDGADVVTTAGQACACDVTGLYDQWIRQAGPVDVP